MTTSAQLRTILQANVFSDPSVTGLTLAIFDRKVTHKNANEIEQSSHEQALKYIEWTCSRTVIRQIAGLSESEYEHTLEVTVTIEHNANPQAFNQVIDALQTIEARISATANHSNWSNRLMPYQLKTVDTPTLLEVDSRDCWTARMIVTFLEIAEA